MWPCALHIVSLRGTFGNRPKGSEDMERTRNARVNHLTLTCDLDLESR